VAALGLSAVQLVAKKVPSLVLQKALPTVLPRALPMVHVWAWCWVMR
jgi:hypothetical protein